MPRELHAKRACGTDLRISIHAPSLATDEMHAYTCAVLLDMAGRIATITIDVMGLSYRSFHGVGRLTVSLVPGTGWAQ
jgi:hypothetical protein